MSIQPGYVNQMSPFMKVINEDQINEIMQAAFLILERTGCKVSHPEALKLLKQAGATIKGDTVFTPQYLVEEGLRTVPKGFMIYDREGNP